MNSRRLARGLVRAILAASPDTIFGRARLKALIALRRALVRRWDPLLEWRVGDVELLLPLSHELPFYRHDHPRYDKPIGEIAADVGGPVVDVGANVGDTAAEIRSRGDVPILCVEGDDRFFMLLAANAPRIGGLELEHAFVDAPTAARVERGAGTARLVGVRGSEPQSPETLRSKPLAQILEEHPAFREPALLKLDTDGMDVPIVLASLDLLARTRPVLFFEYDPHLGATPDVFERLREIGYRRLDVYENTGELAQSVDLPGAIHEEYAGHGGARYADVCIWP
jgi:FkbM family methyltransferase